MKKVWAIVFLTFIFCQFTTVWSQEVAQAEPHQHYIAKINPEAHSVELEDGSTWSISLKSSKLSTWQPGDRVEFLSERMIFLSHYLINLETKDKSKTKMLKTADDAVALYIIDFDVDSKIITLSDQSKWKICDISCSSCLKGYKQRFKDKVFVAKQYNSSRYHLASFTSATSMEILAVLLLE